ncbi:hypothetical protein IMZ31_11645 [Pontibacillus sp. ALD_SL1]|uniref:YesK family protein n=1 Tax=Pontibacillus sp. ALD_SL1 TaxID=2777185 RepID=UPI001A97CEA8|nr:YesK family protein [Pontibacillus sp. ALD_SL1]QSS98759.1 hypothetical protein IMZ31_11645 [Pontibacillus sp. ALD_SL1]
MSYLLMTAIITIILICASLLFKKNKSQLQYILSPLFMLISFVLLLISFLVGRWEGLGIGALSFSVLIASIITSIVMGSSVFLTRK